jgi:hypothetical protein
MQSHLLAGQQRGESLVALFGSGYRSRERSLI